MLPKRTTDVLEVEDEMENAEVISGRVLRLPVAEDTYFCLNCGSSRVRTPDGKPYGPDLRQPAL